MTPYRMRSTLALASACLALLASDPPARSQALPQAVSTPVSSPTTGFALPAVAGQISYSLTASQIVDIGYNGQPGTVTSTNLTGNLGYVSSSETHPFSAVYSGGYLGSESSQLPRGTFQTLSLSQVFHLRHNTIIGADSVSYLPQSPVAGISGIPGLGDLGAGAVQVVGGYTGVGILTQNQSRVSNIASLSDVQDITGKTSIHGTGTYAIQRFLGDGPLSTTTINNNGFLSYDSNEVGAAAGFTHRLNRRNTFGADYTFARFTYPNQPYSFISHGLLGEYSHQFTPSLVFDGAAGPQWNTSSTYSATAINLAALLSLTYAKGLNGYALTYSRGTNNGSGVVQGAFSNSVGFLANRRFSRNLSGAASVSYAHTSSIPSLLFTNFSVDTVVASGQVSRNLGRSFSVYGSYTVERQNTSTAVLSNLAFNGISQIIGFGITYSPASRFFGGH